MAIACLWKTASDLILGRVRSSPIPSGILAALIFAGDLSAPAGVSVNALYAVVIVLAALSEQRWAPFVWAALCTALSVGASFVGPTILPLTAEILDRTVTICAIWVVAGVSVMLRAEIERANAAQKLAKAAEDAKQYFIAVASHDIRHSAQSINLFTSFLQQTLTDERSLLAVNNLSASVEALNTLLKDILDFSKLEMEEISPDRKIFPLSQIMVPIGAEYMLRAKDKNLRFSVVATKLCVYSDRLILARILRNLIENAIRYTAAGRILVGCRRSGGQVRLDVIDTGAGIPQQQIDRIFQEFTQLNPTDPRGGHGLGLSIVAKMANLLDHPLEVASIEGRGSRFSILLPIGADLRTDGDRVVGAETWQ